jgi:hypothetical protein
MGVVLCLLVLAWFASGIVMMYWSYPAVRAEDRLERSPSLDASQIRLSPSEAFAKTRMPQPAAAARLNVFDGRPVYRFRAGRAETLVYADTGELQTAVTPEMILRAASEWTGQPAAAASADEIREVDQWTVAGGLRTLRPLWKFSWPNGEQVYVSGVTGEVVQYTTTTSRFWAWLGAIPHWLYFTPLRKHQPEWSRVVIWTSGVGTVASLLGIVIAVWVYSPSKRYRFAGTSAAIPYRGSKRWHTILGLVFGAGAATWAFSGMLSMDPFPSSPRRPAPTLNLPGLLRGRFQLPAFDNKTPANALAELAGSQVKELEMTSFAGEPVYLAAGPGGQTRIVPLSAQSNAGFGPDRIIRVVRNALGPHDLLEVRLMHDYDTWYLDRRRERPLPVVLVRLNDPDRTRYYVDPKTGRIVGNYSTRAWTSRWLYHGLHSLEFPWLYKHRPLWDIVMISFMLGGTSLSVTSLILAWRALLRPLKRRLPGFFYTIERSHTSN